MYKYNSGKQVKHMHSMTRDALCDAFSATDRASRDLIASGAMFYVDTDVGILRGALHGPTQVSPRRWMGGWVHFQFDNVDRAKTKFESGSGYRLNPYSGKWNWHFGDGSILSYMVDELSRVNARNFRLTP